MKRKTSLSLLLCTSALAVSCASSAATKTSVPSFHPIPYDAALQTLDDADGADAYDHGLEGMTAERRVAACLPSGRCSFVV